MTEYNRHVFGDKDSIEAGIFSFFYFLLPIQKDVTIIVFLFIHHQASWYFVLFFGNILLNQKIVVGLRNVQVPQPKKSSVIENTLCLVTGKPFPSPSLNLH